MSRTIYLHLSSCGQTPKFLDIPGAKRVQSLLSLPRISCCFRMEKASHSVKRKLSNSNSSWSYFEVYGNGQGFLSTSEGAVCRTSYEESLHQAGSSRVLAAWKKIRSWSPVKTKNEDIIRERPSSVQSSASRNDHSRGQAATTRRIKAEAYVGQSRGFRLSRVISQPSNKKVNSRRQLAVTAIKKALTPTLHPQRQGQGELSLRMANFLLTFMSSAQTNEIQCCTERFYNSLETMLRRTEAAEREVKAIQSWINDAENQLHEMPTERDIERLESLLDRLLCHSVAEDPSRSIDGQQLGFPKEESVQEKRDEFLQAASNLKYILANMHTVAEIRELDQEFDEIDKELSRCSDSSREAVNLLRSAIARGEVAWLQNLESGAACLEAMARAVLPLEGLYSTNS